MLTITFTRPPTLSSVTRGEAVTNAAQALSSSFAAVVSSDGEALGAVVGGPHVWARSISGSVRLGTLNGSAELRVCIDGAPVVPDSATGTTLSFAATGLSEKRAHTVTVHVREVSGDSVLSGTTTLSVTATDWGTDVVKDPDEPDPDEDDE